MANRSWASLGGRSQRRLRWMAHGPTMARPVTAPDPARSAGPRSAAPRQVPLPRTWSFGAVEVVAVLAANAVVILAMWLRHGGLDDLATLGAQLTAVGQLTGLYGTYLALIQVRGNG